MIQSEYGWSDEAVLELPICRMRQILANVEERRKAHRKYEQTIAEWQTKTLAEFIAATVPVPGKSNPLLDAAHKIQLKMEDSSGKSDSDVSMEKYLEEGSQVAMNSPGSYERLMAGFSGR